MGISQETRVSVTNTGSAIDPMLLPRLFDRFYRADASRAHPESEGAGLGLSITRAIVQAHGGSVQASSSEGKTRFVLVFPSQACALAPPCIEKRHKGRFYCRKHAGKSCWPAPAAKAKISKYY